MHITLPKLNLSHLQVLSFQPFNLCMFKKREELGEKGRVVVLFKIRDDVQNGEEIGRKGEVPAKRVDLTICMPSHVAVGHANLLEGSVKEWRQ